MQISFGYLWNGTIKGKLRYEEGGSLSECRLHICFVILVVGTDFTMFAKTMGKYILHTAEEFFKQALKGHIPCSIPLA